MAKPWRTSKLPPDWPMLRLAVFERDGYRCTYTRGDWRCPTTAGLECDHQGSPRDHSMANLRTLCGYHHGQRTASQGAAGRKKSRGRGRGGEGHPYFG